MSVMPVNLLLIYVKFVVKASRISLGSSSCVLVHFLNSNRAQPEIATLLFRKAAVKAT